ncbi:DUF5690 family protein [Sphingobacterium pedocola]|uniref:MFS transporter n=1 Tax=Sphingobacterium pedocola TaxID=2082722 RepID=A0ABR9TCN6_9SPHI|nr:DUF5690 family protein [Sphingobacterium pedocola]MBE8722619.1 hypothetical protein [Sphingobacterium pedocola]
MKYPFQVLMQRLGNASYTIQMILLALAAFGCYTSMYAYRKAFTAALFTELPIWGVDYKVWLVIAQVFGYMLSKFYGIKFVSELGQNRRGAKLLLLIGVAWLALLGFAFIPAPYNIVCMFINGLPLGMIWGIVFSYLEGRRATEFLAAIMSVSLVFASGFVKSLARFLMEELHVTEQWMPFATGLLFAIPLLVFTLVLEAMPPPDAKDKLLRNERKAMTHGERIAFLKMFLPGLVVVVFVYLIFSVLRDIRDNFEVEIWADIGVTETLIYVQTDSLIALVVLALMGLLICVKNNIKAFTYIHVMLFMGCFLAGIFTYLFRIQAVGGVTWMVMTGLGLYMVYIPFNAIFFERFLASFKVKGNIGFLMYVADSVGYLGSVCVLLVRELGLVETSWGGFFEQAILLAAVLGCISVVFSIIYFRRKKVRDEVLVGDMELAR